MNVEIGTEAAQFPEKEYINGIFVAVWACIDKKSGNFHILAWQRTTVDIDVLPVCCIFLKNCFKFSLH
jgi:hypothetical protein